MANPYETNQQIHSGNVNGIQGHWVPVDATNAPMDMSTNPNQPSIGPDGQYYYQANIQGQAGMAPISSNMNNAIPTPSQIVQLPPIVQPIAMVPYTTQNQPLVQYDPNYRPPVEKTAAPEPVYKPKPFAAISALVALFALAAIVVACLLKVYGDTTVVSAVLDLVNNGIGELSGLDAILGFVVPIGYMVIVVLCLIVLINALVHLGKQVPLRKINGWALAALLIAIAEVVILIIKDDIFEIQIGAYVVAALIFVYFLLPLIFVNRKVLIVDYVASKETYVIKD